MTAALDLIATCAVGLEDLVLGDLRTLGLSASQIGAGELLVTEVTDISPLLEDPKIDRLATPWAPGDNLQAAESACRAAGFDGDIAFRVHTKDAATREDLVAAVHDSTGWTNSVNEWQVNLDPQRERAEIGPLAWAARFGTMQRLPATTPPAVAAAILRLAKLRAGMNLVDPCGGVGTIPIVDALGRDGLGLAIDINPASVHLAQQNIETFGQQGRVLAEVGDATHLDLADRSVDRVVTDVPFGKRIGSTDVNKTLYPGLVAEVDRVLTPDGRAVIITDDKRRFSDAVARQRGLKIVKETTLRYNGVTPSAFTIARVRSRG